MRLKQLFPLIGLFIFLIVLSQIDLERVLIIFQSIHPLYVFLSFFIFIPLLILVTIEWQMLLKSQNISVSFSYAFKNFFIGYFLGFITPGGVGGYSRAVYLAEESNQPVPKCFSNIVIFNTIELLAMFIPGFIGAIVLSRIYPFLSEIIILFVVFILGLYIFFYKSKHSRSLFKRIIRSNVFDSLNGRFNVSIDSFYDDVPSLRKVIIPFCLSIAGWLLKYVLLFYVAHLFNIYIPFLWFIVILAVSDVIASIPISIYGLGTREAALITMFSFSEFTGGVSIAAEQIVSLSLFWFVIIWVVPSFIGFFITYAETKKLYGFDLTKKNCTRFEHYMRKHVTLYKQLAAEVKQNIVPTKDNPVIIDLGIGPGILSEEIQQIIPNANIIGIDPSLEMLHICKKHNLYGLIKATSETISISTNSVDVVVSRFNLTYWDDPIKGFKEIYRILKPGGTLILEALNKDFSSYQLFLIKIHMIFKRSGVNIAQYHSDAYTTASTITQAYSYATQAQFQSINVKGNKKDWKFTMICKK